MERLLSDRKDIAKQIKDLKEKIEDETDGPPIKKLAWLAENGDKTEVSFEVDKMNKEIATLEGEMVLRNAQISELQQKIVDADQGRYYFYYSNIVTDLYAILHYAELSLIRILLIQMN